MKQKTNKMVTSIDWLLQELEKFNHPTEAMIMYAKKLHKKETLEISKNSYIAGYLDYQSKVDDSMNFPEEIYNETFNK